MPTGSHPVGIVAFEPEREPPVNVAAGAVNVP